MSITQHHGATTGTRAGWLEAREVAFAAASVVPVETVPLDAAVGRILVEPVSALLDVPHYASSAMDGWAVAGAGPWDIVERAALRPGEATAIVTGGDIPIGADAVVRSEIAERFDGRLHASTPTRGHHIRPAGEEATRGETVIAAGTVLNPAHVALAAGAGHDTLTVRGAVTVSLALTGGEVITAGLPAAGQVRDSFGPQLPAMLRMLGASVTSSRRVADTIDDTIAALSQPGVALVISTGGTGNSARDHLRTALERLGAEMLIDGIRMRPGGPTLLARLPGGSLVLALPGNPLAAMLALLTIGGPLIAGMTGVALPDLDTVTLAVAVDGVAGGAVLMPYRLENGAAVPNRHRASGMMRGLADAAGVLVVPSDGAKKGDRVTAIALPWN
ncbi:molybdopterin molybdotransferase MoeA [Lacisediminihabitans changchengi]|uniref:Molybdopterin molybdenumtransferase n=1 Tax=Lacisediminihabitans changchengi TaxID=2787634 RepID=A0A934SRH6_9MICO|nr:molybdopterin molybdotransferase MoeA [Lacisediminihabitans changchengi]MBK4346799.1 molybdopterin molybdotransferase MoeA [Lacisediminihabitans changchengi]MBK4348078.1 molybdopterin molybdotransferase MoeA [Lacisediminihabitans changchengi]